MKQERKKIKFKKKINTNVSHHKNTIKTPNPVGLNIHRVKNTFKYIRLTC